MVSTIDPDEYEPSEDPEFEDIMWEPYRSWKDDLAIVHSMYVDATWPGWIGEVEA